MIGMTETNPRRQNKTGMKREKWTLACWRKIRVQDLTATNKTSWHREEQCRKRWKTGRKKFLAKGVIACQKSWRNWKKSSLKSIAALNEEVDELNFLLQDCAPRSQMPTGNIYVCKSSTVCAFFITNWTPCTYLPHSSCFSPRCEVFELRP